MQRHIITFLLGILSVVEINAETFDYRFNSTPLSEALTQIAEEHPSTSINFIYNELENYKTSARIHTNDPYKAIQQTVGFNHVNITGEGKIFYVEAPLHGTYCYTGTVTDSDGEAVIAAAIMVLSPDGTTPITYGITDLNGNFSIPCDKKDVTVKINCLGFEEYTMRAPKSCDFGTIVLNDSPFMLDEVTVSPNLPVTTIKGNALVTNVENSVLAKMGTAYDVLSHIPMVTGSDGTLSVFGRGEPTIYINGREVRDKTDLQQLKADNIRSVELITNPGAAYASDVTSVIRIKTIPQKGDGFGIDIANTLNAWSYARNTTDINLRYRHNGVDIFGNLYVHEGKRKNEDTSVMTTYGDRTFIQSIHNNGTSSTDGLSGKIGMSYMISPNHSVGAYYRLGRTKTDGNGTLYTRSDLSGNNTSNPASNDASSILEQTRSEYRNRSNSYPSQEANLYYNGNVGGLAIDFNADYLQSRTKSHDIQKDYPAGSGEGMSSMVNADGKTDSRLIAEKFVITHPVWKGEIEAGEEYTNSRLEYDYNYTGASINNSLTDIHEDNFAGFVTVSQRFGRWDLSFGLRYEFAKYRYFENGKLNESLSKDYNNLFPSFTAATKIGRVRLSLDFTNKMRRPSYRKLDGGVSYINRYVYQSGNPLLKPTKIYNLQAMGMWRYFYAVMMYTHEKDAVFNTTLNYGDDPLVKLLTFMNVPHYQNLQFTLGAQPTFGCWQTTPEIGVLRQFCSLDVRGQKKSFDKPMYSFTWDNIVSLPHDWQIGADLWFYSAANSQNCHIKPTQQISLSVRKSLLNETLILQLKAVDILDRGSDRVTIFSGDIRTYMYNHHEPRNISFTARYIFNKARSKYKGTGAGKSEKRRM